VFILKEVKVACFHTLLEVFILKELRKQNFEPRLAENSASCKAPPDGDALKRTPTPFVAGSDGASEKTKAPASEGGRYMGDRPSGYPTPRVFLQKSAEPVENKGSECAKERKERKRVGKQLKMRDLN
jgi:hypothetical protein